MYIEDWYWQDYAETNSTNDIAIELSANPPHKKFVITARQQNKGRGRRGRNWVGLDGNLFVSLGLEVEPKDIGILSFVTSLAVLNVIKQLDSHVDVKVKWPNDVLLNNKKVTGILIEKADNNYFVVGVGVNIASHPENIDLLYEATNLKNNNIQIDRVDFLKLYLVKINQLLTSWQTHGFDLIKNDWLKNAKNLGEKIVVKTEKATKEGVFYGADDNGYLLLETTNGIEKIYAGDVFYI